MKLKLAFVLLINCFICCNNKKELNIPSSKTQKFQKDSFTTMNEKELILKKGEQPVANITDDELRFLIERDFPNQTELVKTKLNIIKSDSQHGKNRISASVLKLVDRDLTKIDYLVKRANEDFRDIIAEAEYPRTSSHEFGDRNEEELKQDYLKDWEEYSEWKKR